MSLSQLAPIQVILSPGATPLPQFGTSGIFEELTSDQYAKFIGLSGGLSTLKISAIGLLETLAALGITTGERAYEDTTKHFGGQRVPEEAYLVARGVADQVHKQTVQILPDAGSSDKAAVGKYAINDIQGGPYSYLSPGLAQVITATVTDVGAGLGATGTYLVEDAGGFNFAYDSGGLDVWTHTITAAATGLYTLVVSGITYSYTAGVGDDIEAVRDGLFAKTLLSAHTDWTGNKVSTDQITVTGNNVGETLVVTSNLGPGGTEATIVNTTPIVPELVATIATGIAAAITGAPSVPTAYAPIAAGAVVTFTANPGFEGVDLGIIGNGPTPADLIMATVTDYREDVVTVRDAIDTLIQATNHPAFVGSTISTDTMAIDGVVAGEVVPLTVKAVDDNILLVEVQGVLTFRTAQTYRTSIATNPADSFAYVGSYSLTAFGTTVNYIAGASELATTVRDAVQAQVDANIPEVTSGVAGTDAFDMTSNTAGKPFGVVLSSPNGDAAMTGAIVSASIGMNNDVDQAIVDAPDWYIVINSGTQVDIESVTDHLDAIASSTPRMHFWQHRDVDMINTPIAGADDVGALTFNTGTRRSKGLWNPEPVTADATAKSYEGVTSQWVGNYMSLLPGQIQPTGKRQGPFTSRNRLTVAQESNLTDRTVQYMEWVPTLGATGGQVMQGRLTPAGRLIDLQRALDQIRAVYQQLAIDLITSTPIIPYTNAGIGLVNNAVVVEGTNILRTQGLVISQEAKYTAGRMPRTSDASQADRELGRLPPFIFEIIIQLGSTEIPITVNVSQ